MANVPTDAELRLIPLPPATRSRILFDVPLALIYSVPSLRLQWRLIRHCEIRFIDAALVILPVRLKALSGQRRGFPASLPVLLPVSERGATGFASALFSERYRSDVLIVRISAVRAAHGVRRLVRLSQLGQDKVLNRGALGGWSCWLWRGGARSLGRWPRVSAAAASARQAFSCGLCGRRAVLNASRGGCGRATGIGTPGEESIGTDRPCEILLYI